MPSIKLDTLSTFGRATLKLDAVFSELVRLGGQIERLDIESDSGLERALKLLDEFARQGEAVSASIQTFSATLQEARERSEAAASRVAQRAEEIRRRKEQQAEIRDRLIEVERGVQSANAHLVASRRVGTGALSEQEQQAIRLQLEQLDSDLKKFISTAQQIKETAGQSNFKSIERDAQTLIDALRSSSRKVEKAVSK